MPDLKRPFTGHRVLVVEKNESLPPVFSELFSALPPSQFDMVATMEQAYKKLSLAAYDLIMLAESLPENLQETLLSPLKNFASEVPIIIVTDHATARVEILAKDRAPRVIVSRDCLASPLFTNVLRHLLAKNSELTNQNDSISAGVVGVVETMRSKNELLQQAEAALTEAKRKGRNRVWYWQAPLGRRARERHPDQSAIDEIRERFAELQKEFKKNYLQSSLPIIEEMEAADGYLKAHSRSVARLSTRLARRLDLNQTEIEHINTAALLHDIGKLAIGGDILRKRTPLSESEFDLIKKHPLYGVAILSHTHVFDEELPLILHHHERFDGAGYPHGLKGEHIPLGARIICIAEAFEGLTAGAVYRAAISSEKAVAEMARCAGSHFDPELVTILINLVRSASRGNHDDHMEA